MELAFKLLGEVGWSILYFPVWWYSRGFLNLLDGLRNFIVNREKSLGLLIWMKNIAVPMFGQYDWQGRLISFLVRLFQIILRGLIMLFWLFLCFVLALIWLALPVYVIYQILFQASII